MDLKHTVFVLGAGASIPYGLPSGYELFQSICSLSNHTKSSVDLKALESVGISGDRVRDFAISLVLSGLTSVDAFLEHQRNFIRHEEVGKACIAYFVMKKETPFNLTNIDSIKVNGTMVAKDDWYRYLFNTLTDNIEHDDFANLPISFLTFNYDRSLDLFLWYSIKNTYQLSDDETRPIYESIPIIHLHGSLGSLPLYSTATYESGHVPYGGIMPSNTSVPYNCLQIARKSINIIHEDIDTTAEFTKAHVLLEQASRIYVTGFSFHPKSVKRLRLFKYGKQVEDKDSSEFLASTKGLEPAELSRIAKLDKHWTSNLWLRNLNTRVDYHCTTLQFIRRHIDMSPD